MAWQHAAMLQRQLKEADFENARLSEKLEKAQLEGERLRAEETLGNKLAQNGLKVRSNLRDPYRPRANT